MPEISRFFGIVIKMIFNDSDKHHKPHVHVYYGNTKHPLHWTEKCWMANFPQNSIVWFPGGWLYMKMNCMKHGIRQYVLFRLIKLSH